MVINSPCLSWNYSCGARNFNFSDAYQEQIKQGRDQRLSIQRELDQLRDSNAELIKSIERKELEMKILHDSYQVQMELERKKCEELEKEVLQLKGANC